MKKKFIIFLIIFSNLCRTAEFINFQEQQEYKIDFTDQEALEKFLFTNFFEMQENISYIDLSKDDDNQKELNSKNVKEALFCDECNNNYCYSSRSVLDRHKQYIHSNRSIQCKKCKSILKNKGTLQAHLKLIHSKFKCDQCHKKFKNIHYLKCHQLHVHNVKSDESILGSNKKNLNIGKINLQNLSQFLTIKKLEEIACENNNNNNEGDDLDSIHNQDQANLKLPEKNEEYKTFENYDKPFCNKCKKFYATTCSLNKHIKDIHKAVISTCNECNKLFKNEDGLIRHINRVHKMKNCDICNQLFKDNENLKNHQFKIHYV